MSSEQGAKEGGRKAGPGSSSRSRRRRLCCSPAFARVALGSAGLGLAKEPPPPLQLQDHTGGGLPAFLL